MVPSTTFPNPRRFPQQQELVKSTCRCMYWFRRLKYCAPCHPVVFAFAPSSCWLRLELFFWRLHELQRRAVGSSKALDKFVIFEIWRWCCNNLEGSRCCSLFRFGKLRQLPSTELETTSNIDFLRVNCSTNVKFQNLKFVERLWRSDCPPLRFEKIIDLLFSSVLPHGVSWYDACEVSPPVVVVSGRCWWSAVRVVAHAVVVERRSVPISKDWGWWKQF